MRISLFHLYPLSIFSIVLEFWVEIFFFSTENILFYFIITSIVSDEKSSYSSYCSPRSNVSFFPGCFQTVFFVFGFYYFNEDVSKHVFLWVYPDETDWISWICKFMPFVKFETSLDIIPSNIFLQINVFSPVLLGIC